MASLHDGSLYCITELQLPTNATSSHLNYRNIYSIVCLSSGTLGLLGSGTQLLVWMMSTNRLENSEKKTAFVNPIIIICLAIANLLTCVGVIIRSTCLIFTKPPTIYGASMSNISYHSSADTKTVILGTIFEGLTNFSYIAAVLWTLCYSIDVHRRQRNKKDEESQLKNNGRASTYNFFCWGLSLVFTAGSLFVVYYQTNFPERCPDELRYQYGYLISYSPVVAVLIVNPILLISARRLVRKNIQRMTATYSRREREIVRKITWRFTMLTIIFSLCWIPNVIDSILQVVISDKYMPTFEEYQWLFPLWIMEGIMNPLQGFLNCFIFGLPGCPSIQCTTEEDYTESYDSHSERSSLLSTKSSVQRHCIVR